MKKKIFSFIFVLLIALNYSNVAAANVTYAEQFPPKLAEYLAKTYAHNVNDEITPTIIDFVKSYQTLYRGIDNLDGLEIFTNLTSVTTAGGKLDHFPSNLSSLPNLTSLGLADVYLKDTDIPTSLGDFTKLEDISWTSNLFTTLPKGITTLPNIKKVNLDGNSITSLTTEDELFLRGLVSATLKNQTTKIYTTEYVPTNADFKISSFPILSQSKNYSVPLKISYTLTDSMGDVVNLPEKFDSNGAFIIDGSTLSKVETYKFVATIEDASGMLNGSSYTYQFFTYPGQTNPANPNPVSPSDPKVNSPSTSTSEKNKAVATSDSTNFNFYVSLTLLSAVVVLSTTAISRLKEE